MSQVLYKGGTLWGHGKADMLVEGNRISAIGPNLEPDDAAELEICDGKFIYPGLINTHHHLTQSLAKAMPAGINSDLNHWLGAVPFALWHKITPDIMYHSALVGFYELIRSGCTTCADHFYIYHQDFDGEIESALYQAAADCGIRFVHCRGGATHLGSHRGANATSFSPETCEQFLTRLDRTRSVHHDDAEDSMSRLVAAPTSIVHTSPPEHLREIAAFARANKLRMHSHLLEVRYDDEAALKVYRKSAIDYAAYCDWLGPDVWFAHLVHADDYAIKLLAETGTGIAHCPSSNCRLGSGIANVPSMNQRAMPISIGVDGSASAESGSMFNELMMSWLIHRADQGANSTEITTVMEWGTKGGAKTLGFDKLGSLQTGMLADFCIIDLDQPRFWGLWQTEWAPVVCGEPLVVEKSVINGKTVFENGNLSHLDIKSLKSSVGKALEALMA